MCVCCLGKSRQVNLQCKVGTGETRWGNLGGRSLFSVRFRPAFFSHVKGVLASAEPRQARPALCGRSTSRLSSHPPPTVPLARAWRLLSSSRPFPTMSPSHGIPSAASRTDRHGMLGDVVPEGVRPFQLSQDTPPPGGTSISVVPGYPPLGGTSIVVVPGYPPGVRSAT